MANKPSIIIPVEVASRELDGKLLLASIAAQRGFRVFLGCRWRLLAQMHRLPPSVYIGKDVSRRTLRIYDLLPPLGHAAMAWDEEALVYMKPEIYRRLKTWPNSIAAPKVLFAWGEDNAEIWRATDGYAGQPIAVVGNPRADMLRPEVAPFYAEAVSDIRARFGPFVLINSNFGWINHYKESVAQERLRVVGTTNPDLSEHLVGTWDDPGMLTYRHDMFREFLAALPRLADAFPDRRLVLRPHPSENQQTWVEAVAERPNVSVLHEGSAAPWLLAAEAVVQNGCTTGVEAFLLGKPVIAYQPLRHPVYDMPLPNELGTPAGGFAELKDAVAAAFEGQLAAARDPDRDRLARRFVVSVDGPLASDRILDAIEAAAEDQRLFERRPITERVKAQLDCTVRAVTRMLGVSGSHKTGQTDYLQHIFPPTSGEEMRARIARLSLAFERVGGLTVRTLGANLFEISRA